MRNKWGKNAVFHFLLVTHFTTFKLNINMVLLEFVLVLFDCVES